jgi:hypothetical protein
MRNEGWIRVGKRKWKELGEEWYQGDFMSYFTIVIKLLRKLLLCECILECASYDWFVFVLADKSS